MKYGVFQFSTDYAMRIDELARETEARGFESLFVPEHTHIPASRKSPWPGGADLPREYWHTVDPFVALAAAAAVTTRLKLGTGICLVIERDPIMTAKEVATLDLLSGGRVDFASGRGYDRNYLPSYFDVMYEVPGRTDVGRIIIDADCVNNRTPAELVPRTARPAPKRRAAS